MSTYSLKSIQEMQNDRKLSKLAMITALGLTGKHILGGNRNLENGIGKVYSNHSRGEIPSDILREKIPSEILRGN